MLYVRQKSYKFRLYPTKEQEILLSKTFGCVRYVYNRALEIKTSAYQKDKQNISIYEIIKEIPKWKREQETEWLKEVSASSLQSSLLRLDSAYTKFFKEKKGFPKFKSKYDKQSFQNPAQTKIDLDTNLVYIPKFKKGIKCVFDRQFKGEIKTSTVSKVATGKYFISILVEEDIQIPELIVAKEDRCLGIDLGIKNFATLSDGNIIPNPKHLNKKLKQLKRQQRKLSRKQKGSKNRDKQRKKVAIIHEKVANCRKDFLHKLSSNLVKNQDYDSFAMEKLDIQGMIQKAPRRVARAIGDAGWFSFKQMMGYKCEWSGKNLLEIGRFEPSSKLCTCGQINEKLSLKDRDWTCINCNVTHNRDVLAANNIKRFAFCKQNTYKNLIGQELPEFTLVETAVRRSRKQEISEKE